MQIGDIVEFLTPNQVMKDNFIMQMSKQEIQVGRNQRFIILLSHLCIKVRKKSQRFFQMKKMVKRKRGGKRRRRKVPIAQMVVQ